MDEGRILWFNKLYAYRPVTSVHVGVKTVVGCDNHRLAFVIEGFFCSADAPSLLFTRQSVVDGRRIFRVGI